MAEKAPGLKELTAAVADAYAKFEADKKGDTLRKLYDTLFNLNAALREEMQKNTAEAIKILISKFENGTPPTPDDMQLIRLWLVGDAEAYSGRENDFANWTSELTRLMSALSESSAQAPGVKAAMALQGTITDALGVIPGMQRYLEALDRVKRFENSTKTMDGPTMMAIKELLKGKLKSTND